MKYISADKFEKKLWVLAFIYLLFFLVVGFVFQLIGDTPNIKHYPVWWNESMNIMKIILLFLISSFVIMVIMHGRKILKQRKENK